MVCCLFACDCCSRCLWSVICFTCGFECCVCLVIVLWLWFCFFDDERFLALFWMFVYLCLWFIGCLFCLTIGCFVYSGCFVLMLLNLGVCNVVWFGFGLFWLIWALVLFSLVLSCLMFEVLLLCLDWYLLWMYLLCCLVSACFFVCGIWLYVVRWVVSVVVCWILIDCAGGVLRCLAWFLIVL